MWIRARIEKNCRGSEFFMADMSFFKMYEKAGDIAGRALKRHGLDLPYETAAHTLLLYPQVRQEMDLRQIDYLSYNVWFFQEGRLYLIHPETLDLKIISDFPDDLVVLIHNSIR